MRVALYYAPDREDPLASRAAAWLGRDAETNAPLPQPDVEGIAELTAEPRLYGFHATLKPPFRIKEGLSWSGLIAACRELARAFTPFELPALAIRDVYGFLALRETAPCPMLQAFSDACVAQVDEFRAPSTQDELARRRRSDLTPQQDAGLTRWGYPYVFGTWFFHMTLTRRLSAEEKVRIQPEAERYFAAVIAAPRTVADVSLFTQESARDPFVVAERIPLG